MASTKVTPLMQEPKWLLSINWLGTMDLTISKGIGRVKHGGLSGSWGVRGPVRDQSNLGQAETTHTAPPWFPSFSRPWKTIYQNSYQGVFHPSALLACCTFGSRTEDSRQDWASRARDGSRGQSYLTMKVPGCEGRDAGYGKPQGKVDRVDRQGLRSAKTKGHTNKQYHQAAPLSHQRQYHQGSPTPFQQQNHQVSPPLFQWPHHQVSPTATTMKPPAAESQTLELERRRRAPAIAATELAVGQARDNMHSVLTECWGGVKLWVSGAWSSMEGRWLGLSLSK